MKQPPILTSTSFIDDAETFKLLVDAGADIHGRNSNGQTPLHLAAASRNIQTMQILLDAGAEVNAKDNNGNTPLLVAKPGELQLANDNRKASFKLAAGSELASLLLKYGADPNVMSKDGQTPLIRACKNRDAALVKLLLDNGASPNIKGNKGWTALHCAVTKNGNTEVVKLLLAAKADVNAENDAGQKPIELTKDTEVVTLLKAS